MPWRLNQASGFRQQGKYNRTSAAERSEIRREAVHPPPVQDAPPCPDLAHPEFYSKSSVFFPPLSNHPMKNAQVIPGEPKKVQAIGAVSLRQDLVVPCAALSRSEERR